MTIRAKCIVAALVLVAINVMFPESNLILGLVILALALAGGVALMMAIGKVIEVIATDMDRTPDPPDRDQW